MGAQTYSSEEFELCRSLSLEDLFQQFPELANTIADFLDDNSKKRLRACSRTCMAAVNPSLKRVTLACCTKADALLLQSTHWHHLQELRLQ
jgi:hypothetical protein